MGPAKAQERQVGTHLRFASAADQCLEYYDAICIVNEIGLDISVHGGGAVNVGCVGNGIAQAFVLFVAEEESQLVNCEWVR